MTQLIGQSVDRTPAQARQHMIEQLHEDGFITSPLVEAAFHRVPRERFAPTGMSLAEVYNPDNSVATKRDEHGVIISSISAPFLQARMIEQADLEAGMHVLEIGSGGYNAALLAEIVGPTGRVVSMDIDPEVTSRASTVLDALGYGDRVEVQLADAENIDGDRFDRIIVTVGAWDIPPAWLKSLNPDGVLVVPLRMNGVTRSIAMRLQSDHLASTSAQVCGFVAMQGKGEHAERVFLLPDSNGKHVKLRFDTGVPENPALLDGVLKTERVELWSDVTFPKRTSFADLHLWLAGFLPGFCLLAVDDGTELAQERGSWFPFGVVRDDSFAYLSVRPAANGGDAVEFGARAYGNGGQVAARALVQEIQAWDVYGRSVEPHFAYWPHGSQIPEPDDRTALFEKTHGHVTISWPR